MDGLSPWKHVHADHPETSTTYVSNTMTQEENVFIREFHCEDIQHNLASMILNPSILKSGLSTLSERKNGAKAQHPGLDATHLIWPLSGSSVRMFQHAAVRSWRQMACSSRRSCGSISRNNGNSQSSSLKLDFRVLSSSNHCE